MKDNDQDDDGRLTYKEFKDSVLEAERAEKHDNPFWKSRPEGNLKHSRLLESLGKAILFSFAHVTISDGVKISLKGTLQNIK